MIVLTEKEIREALQACFQEPEKYSDVIDVIFDKIIDQNNRMCRDYPKDSIAPEDEESFFIIRNNIIV